MFLNFKFIQTVPFSFKDATQQLVFDTQMINELVFIRSGHETSWQVSVHVFTKQFGRWKMAYTPFYIDLM